MDRTRSDGENQIIKNKLHLILHYARKIAYIEQDESVVRRGPISVTQHLSILMEGLAQAVKDHDRTLECIDLLSGEDSGEQDE